jgi:WD40 repeat protein
MSIDGSKILFGGYDKRVVLVDTKLFAIVYDLSLDGTINTIALDPLGRFFVVGCRDKSLTFFDTSTCKPIKRFQTSGWVTSISWGVPGVWTDTVAVRSANTTITILDMTPIHMTDKILSAEEGAENLSVSWSPDGFYLARLVGNSIQIADASLSFCRAAELELSNSSLRCVAFSPVFLNDTNETLLACVALDGMLRLLKFNCAQTLTVVKSVYVEDNLWVVVWSRGKHM